MKKAKGKELDLIIEEVDKIIGYDKMAARDPEAEAEAAAHWARGCRDSDD
jgi:hypothetical protein